MTPQSPAERRKQLLRAGYAPLPVSGKVPSLKEWEKKTETNDAEIELWAKLFPSALSTGLLTGKLPTLDLDITDEDAVEAAEQLVRERFEERGWILVRIGRAPRRAIPFRTNDPFKKISVSLIAPNGDTDQKIELLCDGQQLVAFGIHEKTGQPYAWFGGEPGQIKREDLPYLHPEEAQQLVDDIADLLCREHGYQRAKARPKKEKTNSGAADANAVADWGFLFGNIIAGRELHDSTRDLTAKLVKAHTIPGAAVNIAGAAGTDTGNQTRRAMATALRRYSKISARR